MIYEAQDRGQAGKRAALFMKMEPSLRLEVIDEARHMVMWDAKELFAQKILDFLIGVNFFLFRCLLSLSSVGYSLIIVSRLPYPVS